MSYVVCCDVTRLISDIQCLLNFQIDCAIERAADEFESSLLAGMVPAYLDALSYRCSLVSSLISALLHIL